MIDHRALRRLRIIGFIEAISTLTLFGVAMPLKYLAGMPMAVTIVGSIHGFLFVLLCAMALRAIHAIPIPTKLALVLMAAAVIPFGPFIVDGRLRAVGERTNTEVV